MICRVSTDGVRYMLRLILDENVYPRNYSSKKEQVTDQRQFHRIIQIDKNVVIELFKKITGRNGSINQIAFSFRFYPFPIFLSFFHINHFSKQMFSAYPFCDILFVEYHLQKHFKRPKLVIVNGAHDIFESNC